MKNRQKRGNDPLPLEWGEEPPPPALPAPPGGDVVVGWSPDRPKRQKISRGGHGPIGHGGGGKPSGPPPLPPPAIVVHPSSGSGDPWPPPRPPDPPVDPPPGVPEMDVVVPIDEEEPRVAPRAFHDRDGWVDGLDGSRIKYTDYPLPGGGNKRYKNWQVMCNVHPPPCRGNIKTRGTAPYMTRAAGDIEPLAYLQEWRVKHPPVDPAVPKSGRKFEPDQAAVVAFAEARRRDLEVDLAAAMARRG